MKRALPWILAGVWAVLLLWWSWGYLSQFLANAGPATVDQLFAALGAVLVGLAPLYGVWRWHRWSQKRLEKSLTKQRNKLDRRLERMGTRSTDERGAAANKDIASKDEPSGARASRT